MLFYGISLIMKEKSNASALRAAEGSATRGREQHELRPRVDDFSYGRGENGARLPWESDKIAKFVEE